MRLELAQPRSFGPPLLWRLLDALRTVGTPLLVGGCVRDRLMGREPIDYDIEVFGAAESDVSKVVARFGNPDLVGKSFGVMKLRDAGTEIDISLPRRERKAGVGHRGFVVGTDPSLTPAEALSRRDFTLNAIASDPFTGELIDPHQGRTDLEAGVLRHVGPAFVEDPLRVMRAFQFAGRFGFTMHPETVQLCRSISDTFREIPVERVWGEWAKWAADSTRPSTGLRVLEQTGWLDHFPEIAALKKIKQDPEWHPEGDVFEHTCHCVDSLVRFEEWQSLDVNERRLVMLATLTHDLGKARTTAYAERRGELRWISPGHDVEGESIATAFLRAIGSPREFVEKVPRLIANHHAHYQGPIPPSAASVRRLARRLAPATVSQWLLVLRADQMGRPPLVSEETARRIEAWAAASRELQIRDAAPKPILLGRHLVESGLAPGQGFKPILDAAFEAQLDGEFCDENGARNWLSRRLAGGKAG